MENPSSPLRPAPSPGASEAEPSPAQGRLAGDGPVGVIDVGSNSVRLVVYERLARSPTPLFNEKVLAGLGAGVAETGSLSPDAVEAARSAIARFSALARQMRVKRLDVLATAAAREARNGPDFIALIERVCGVPVAVLTGQEEARLAAYGVVAGIEQPDGIVGDLGGGSLELTDVAGRRVGTGETLPLGGLRLRTASKASLKNARDLVRAAFEDSGVLPRMEGRSLYAVGGTWRSLARLHMQQSGYPLHVMHQYRVAAGEFSDFLKLLTRGSLDAVPSIGVVSKQRQGLVPYGAVVLAELLRAGRPRHVVISAFGVREGLLYTQLPPEEQGADPLLSAARELAVLRARSPRHAEELIPWTGEAMRALDIEETEEERRLRAAACLLADIGWRAHPDYRGEQSLSIIAHAAFAGVDHPGRVYLALAVYYRHSGLAEGELGPGIRELAPARYRERARALAAIFRVGYLVSASMPGIIPLTRIRRSGDALQLVLPGHLAALAGERLQARMRQLASIGGFTSSIEIEG